MPTYVSRGRGQSITLYRGILCCCVGGRAAPRILRRLNLTASCSGCAGLPCGLLGPELLGNAFPVRFIVPACKGSCKARHWGQREASISVIVASRCSGLKVCVLINASTPATGS